MFFRNRSVRAAITNGSIIAKKKNLISKSVAETGPCPIGESFIRANAESERACLCTFIQNHPAKLSLTPTFFFRVRSSRIRLSDPRVLSFISHSLPIFITHACSSSLFFFLSHLFLPLYLLLSRILSTLSSVSLLVAPGFPLDLWSFYRTRAIARIDLLFSIYGHPMGGRIQDEEVLGARVETEATIFDRLTNSFHLARDATPACIYIAGSRWDALLDIAKLLVWKTADGCVFQGPSHSPAYTLSSPCVSSSRRSTKIPTPLSQTASGVWHINALW